MINPFSIRQEFITSSGIAPDLYDFAVKIVPDLEIDPITKEVTGTPLYDLLNWQYTRFGYQAKPNLQGATFISETGEPWQTKIFGFPNNGNRTGKYYAPTGIGDVPYLPPVPALTWLVICIEHQQPLPERLHQWLKGLAVTHTTLLKSLEDYCLSIGKAKEKDKDTSSSNKNEKNIWLRLLSGSTKNWRLEIEDWRTLRAPSEVKKAHQETSFCLSSREKSPLNNHLLLSSTKESICPLQSALCNPLAVSAPLEFLKELRQQNSLINGYWNWFKTTTIPLTITEGGKKTLSALSIGIPTISLFGCQCGAKYSDSDGNLIPLTLIPELKPLVKGRRVNITFDRDTNPKAKQAVTKGIRRLGRAISKAGGQPHVATWDAELGKGIDDLLVNTGADFVKTVINNAVLLEQWENKALTDISHLVDLEVHQPYLELEIPETAQLIGINSAKKTGKTELLAKIARLAVAVGIPVLVPLHRKQLAKELGRRLGLEYRTELTPQGKQLGYCLCIDSLHPHANPPFKPHNWSGALLMLDEADQVIWHTLNSSTCLYNRVPILESFKELAQQVIEGGGKIFMSDADLSPLAIEYMEKLIGYPVKRWIVQNTYNPNQGKRILYTYDSPEILFKQILEAVKQGKKIIVQTAAQKADSKWSTTNLETLIQSIFKLEIGDWRLEDATRSFGGEKSGATQGSVSSRESTPRNKPLSFKPGKIYPQQSQAPFFQEGVNLQSALCNLQSVDLKILKLDSESVSDRSHPAYGVMGNLNAVLPLYDIVITSPVLETGVSIDVKHFDEVYCFALGVQTVEAVCQTLERVRDDVPRHLYVSKSSSKRIGNGSTDYRKILKSQDRVFKANLNNLSQTDALATLEGEQPEHLSTWVKKACLVNLGYRHYREFILKKLAKEGYEIIDYAAVSAEVDESDKKEIKELINETSEKNSQGERENISHQSNPSDEELNRLKETENKTKQERYRQRKGELCRLYCTEDISPEMVKRDDQGWFGKLTLHYYLTVGKPFLKERDKKKVEKLTKNSQGKVFKPDANKSLLSVAVRALECINIKQFFDPDQVFTHESLREWFELLCQPINRGQIKDYLNMGINPERDNPMGVAQRLLRSLFGIQLTCIGQRRVNGKRIREYKMMSLNPDERMSIFARWFDRDSLGCHTPPIYTIEQKECA